MSQLGRLFGPAPRRRWLLGIICLALSSIPLVGTLGYFSALLLAPLCSLFGMGIAADATPSRARTYGGQAVAMAAVASWRELLWLVLVPLTVLSCGQLWNRNCDYVGGLGWYAMGPVVSTGMGWTAGVIASAWTDRPVPRRLLAATAWLACTAIALARLYIHPVVFAYDPFWGYFSGSLYDEQVAVSSTYAWFRLYNLAAALAGLWLVATWLERQRTGAWPRARSVLGVLSLAAVSVVGWRGDRMGFTTTLTSAREHLSLTRETEHFVIYYSPGSQTEREIDAVATEHEFAWHRLAGILAREPDYKIHSFVFANRRQKRAVFGADRVEISLPWKRQIYLHHQAFPHGALHHELAHAFGAAFGDPIFGLSPAVGLIEGLANALAPRASDGLDLHDQAAILDRLEKRPPLAEIIGVGFWRHASSRAYTTAGSFCAWLIDEHGIDAMTELYRRGGGFEAIYGRTLDELEASWLVFLRARPIADDDVAAMAQRFKRGAIFARACAHRVANLRADAQRALDRGRTDEAVALLETLCELEPGEHRHREHLAYTQAAAQRFAAADDTLVTAIELDGLTDQATASITELRGDVALRRGDNTAAREHYRHALTFAQLASNRRILELKLLAATDPFATRDIVEYFALFQAGEPSQATVIVRVAAAAQLANDPRHGAIGSYLLAHQLHAAERPDLALPHIERAVAARWPSRQPLPSADLARQAHLLLIESLLLTGDYDRARTALDDLEHRNHVPGPDGQTVPLPHGNGHHLEYALWRERIAFFADYANAPRHHPSPQPR